ncbi:MAG: 3-isopropylmalate dehydrogenase [Deltaproteobacteria bacterium]|nr:3-isopropylmalate dehydrogenase [Deltaproteobacteria bacterium]
MKKIAIVPGDGIGIEVTREAVAVLETLRKRRHLLIELVPFDWGAERWLRDRVGLPAGALDELRSDFAAVLFGAVGDPRVPDMAHGREILLGMRFQLDLFVNLRPVRLLNDRLCPLKGRTGSDVDMVILRENTEGVYADMGGIFKKDTPDEIAINEDINTRKGVERIIRAAFELARKRDGKKRVCMSDKANAMRFAHDLWQRTFREVAREYADIEASHLYVDVMAMEMVRNPARFDVVVTNNLFGDILSDLGAGLAGGLGVAASGNINPGQCSLFEPVHGSAPDIAGKGVANPMGSILSAALLLDHIGFHSEAQLVEKAVEKAVAEHMTTRDLGGTHSTEEVGKFIRGLVDEAARG